MKKLICSLILSFAWLTSFAMPSISNLKVTPIAPWGMAIDYTVSGAETADADLPLVVIAPGVNKIHKANNLEGDVKWVNGEHCVYWNQSKDGITTDSRNGPVSVFYCPAYCIIDLSSGAESSAYPVTYLDAEPTGGFNTTEYKTTKLVLKRIEPGTFIMGKDQTDETHRVVLTHPFYIGIFEVTQKQWELVMGSNPSYYDTIRKDKYIGDAKPVNQVSYYDIRKSYTMDSVGSESFVGRLQSRTGIDIDLPSKAQWEYACRAGTTTIYSYGDVADGDYMQSSGIPLDAGMKKPNPWGLYDMHGNVWEWSRDIFTSSSHLVYGVDPIGSVSRGYPICCGGSCYYWYYEDDEPKCASYLITAFSSSRNEELGLRVSITLP